MRPATEKTSAEIHVDPSNTLLMRFSCIVLMPRDPSRARRCISSSRFRDFHGENSSCRIIIIIIILRRIRYKVIFIYDRGNSSSRDNSARIVTRA